MDKGMKVEVEDRELFLVNEAGDKVIIPKDKAAWVKEKLKEGCDGSLFPDWNKVKNKIK